MRVGAVQCTPLLAILCIIMFALVLQPCSRNSGTHGFGMRYAHVSADAAEHMLNTATAYIRVCVCIHSPPSFIESEIRRGAEYPECDAGAARCVVTKLVSVYFEVIGQFIKECNVLTRRGDSVPPPPIGPGSTYNATADL